MSSTGGAFPDLRSLYDATLPAVYGAILHRCGDRTVAEELTQETYIAAVRAMRTGQAVTLPWLHAVARNKVIDHFRRASREERKLRMAYAADPASAADEQVDLGDIADEDTLAALATLPTAQRAALVLRYVDDMSVAGVAEALDKSVRATESLLVRARTALRAALEEQNR